MKIINIFTVALLLCYPLYGQFEKAGLDYNKVTSIAVVHNTYFGQIIIAGTEESGMHFHNIDDNDTVWINSYINNKNISSVYVQNLDSANSKLFWAMVPAASYDSPLIYSNIMPWQSAILPEDSGLDRSNVNLIRSMAGFDYLQNKIQMPVFCCTNDQAVYMYIDRKWSKVWEGPENIVNINFVYALDSTVWAGGVFNGFIATPLLIKSTDFGVTWDTLVLPIGEVFSCYSIATAPGNPDLVFVGLNEHILKSTDGGKSWKNCLPDIYNVIFTSIQINPEHPEQIYAGGKTYDNTLVLFKSENSGNNWKQLLTDCNCIFKGINTMAGTIINDQYVIYVGTDGQGIFTFKEKVTSVNPNFTAPGNFILYQNYPNPFNPNTVISYRLSTACRVNLIIYDALGREIRSLINKIENAGMHTVQFNAADLSSGIYFFKLSAGENISVKKMVLMR